MMQTRLSDNPITKERRDRFLSRQSVIEMRARERARAILDPDGFRELRLLAVTRRSANNLAKALDVF